MSPPSRLLPRVAVACFALLAAVCPAGAKDRPIRSLTLDPEARVIGLFDGLEEGVLETRVSARNEFKASVFITNTSDAPLTVALPEAVTAAHVLKQNPGGLGDPFSFGTGAGADPGTLGRGQPIGGQFGGVGNNAFPNAPFGQGPGNQFPGNAFFSIPPEKTVQIELHTVCLAHGRPTPNARMAYVLRRLEDQVSDPALRELLKDYDPETGNRMALQAAAWHLADGMSWSELSSLPVPRRGGLFTPYFTQAQMESAGKLVESAREKAGVETPARGERVVDRRR